jgi:hypothetical protein
MRSIRYLWLVGVALALLSASVGFADALKGRFDLAALMLLAFTVNVALACVNYAHRRPPHV